MNSIYSLGLLVALIGACLVAASTIVLVYKARTGQRRPEKVGRLALICGLTSLVSGAVSVVVHSLFGHGPDSLEPMRGSQFLMHHKAYLLVALLCLLSLLAYSLLVRKGSQDESAG